MTISKRLFAFCCLFLVAGRSTEVNGQSVATVEIADAQLSLIQNTFVATSLAGLVAELSVAEGDHVEPGDRLIQLDTEQALTELEATKASYDAARLASDSDIHVRYARRTMEVRQRELAQSLEANQRHPGTVSESEIGKQQLEVDQARLAIEQAQHDQLIKEARVREKEAAVVIAESRLHRLGMTAPVSGRVVEVAVQPGEWVEVGKPLVRIVSLDPIRVECFIDDELIVAPLVGSRVEFFPTAGTYAATGEPVKALIGHVTFVSLELHPVTSQARLQATLSNPEQTVRAGSHGRLVIHLP